MPLSALRSKLGASLAGFANDLDAGIRDEWKWIVQMAVRTTRSNTTKASVALVAAMCVAALLVPQHITGTELETRTVAATTQPAGEPGSSEPGRAGVERSAVALAAALGVRTGAEDWRGYLESLGSKASPTTCPVSRLRVSWTPPVDGYVAGAYVGPLGPPPSDRTTRVNGVVLCDGALYEYLGFEAVYEAGRWWLTAVPALAGEETGDLLAGEAEQEGASLPESVAGAAGQSGEGSLPNAVLWEGLPIEEPALHEPQTTCDPIAKTGVLGFRDLLLAAFPGSRNLGVGRACEMPGVSEHKEGRAFDWGVRSDDAAEREAAEAALAWLLSPDEHGREFAIARRTGLMYVIWDGRIWSAERAAEGWRPYVGVSEHRDHIHFSFSWPGARAQTSFWTGSLRDRLRDNAPDLPLLVPSTVPPRILGPVSPFVQNGPPSPPPPNSSTTTTTASTTTTTSAPSPTTTTTSTTTTTTTAPPPVTSPGPTVPPIGLSTFGS